MIRFGRMGAARARVTSIGVALAVLVAVALWWVHGSAQAATACTTTVTSVAAAQSGVAAAQPGDVVCLADGSYGGIELNTSKAAPGVTLRAQNPGGATVNGIDLNGSDGITIA
jgi:poly(beta-D-mannuronate) lyase